MYDSGKLDAMHDSEARRLVIGGEIPTPFSLPWTLGLLQLGQIMCGATLVHPSWAITAAHCLIGANIVPSMFQVAVYRHNLPRLVEHPCSELIVAKSIYKHPSYNGYDVENDIGLIELSRPASCAQAGNPNYDPRMLAAIDGLSAPTVLVPGPTADSSYLGVDATVSGWGSTAPGGQVYPMLMRSASVPVVKPSKCSSLVGAIASTEVCAGPLEGGVDSCTGDSGGPLAVVAPHMATLVGVVSYGVSYACAQPNKPGVYARVSAFTSWLPRLLPSWPRTRPLPLRGRGRAATWAPSSARYRTLSSST